MSGATGEQPEDGHEDREADGASRDTPAESGSSAQDAIDASLHMALSDLERMLDGREGTETARPAATGGHSARDRDAASSDDDGEQYTIPLLDEVVIPGPSPVVPPAPAAARVPATPPPKDDEPSVRARIAARIASEIEVIMQDRIEQALDRAREEIRDRVRNHMDIILPEIVDELVQARRRRDGS